MLKDPKNPGAHPAKKSVDMARIARDHHEALQLDNEEQPDDRKRATKDVLDKLEAKLDDEDKQNLNKYLEYEEIKEALMTLPNGKASGPDGIQAEKRNQ